MGSNENVDVVAAKADAAADRGEGAPMGGPSEGEKGSDGNHSGNKPSEQSAPSPATPSPADAAIGTVYVKPTKDNNLEQDLGRGGGGSGTAAPERTSTNAPPSSNQRENEDEDGSDSSSSDGFLRGLQGDDMFHGMLPDTDIDKLLTKHGDFILHTVEKNAGKGRVIGMSILWNLERIFVQVRAGEGGVTFDMINYKKTIIELSRFHVNEGVPVTIHKTMTPVVPRRPVLREDWELRHDDVQLGDKLGEGAFGEVRLGRLKQRNKGDINVAVKVIKGNVTKQNIEEAMKEARIMRAYNHPNLVRFYGVQAEVEPLMLVMEFVKGGSLDGWLKKNSQQISVQHRAGMCYDAACGLEYLHAHSCIHRDIAARNCLLDIQARRLKISDFGLSSIGTVQVLDPTKPAPIRWLSPEVIRTGCFGKPADVWSFGVLCWEIYMDAEVPYKEYTMAEVQARIIDESFRLRLPLTCQTELRKLIASCWTGDMNRRPTMADCVSTLRPFFDEKGKYISDDAIKKAKKTKTNKVKRKSRPKKESKGASKPRVPESEVSGMTQKSKQRTPSRMSAAQPVNVPKAPRKRKTKPKKGEEEEEDEDQSKSKEKLKPKKRQKSCKSIKPRPRDSDSDEKKKSRDSGKKRRGKSTKSACSPPTDKTSGKKVKDKGKRRNEGSNEDRKKPSRKSRKKESDSEDTRKKDKKRRK